MTAKPDPMSFGLRGLQEIRDNEEYRTELLRLSVEREKLFLERLKHDLQHRGWRSTPIWASLGLGIILGIGIFALLEKLPAIIGAMKN